MKYIFKPDIIFILLFSVSCYRAPIGSITDDTTEQKRQPTRDADIPPEAGSTTPLLQFENRNLTATLHIPRGYVGRIENFVTLLDSAGQQDGIAIIDSVLKSVTDDSVKAVIKANIVNAVPEQAFKYAVINTAFTDSACILTYGIDKQTIERKTKLILNQYLNLKNQPVYPLFSQDTRAPALTAFDNLQLLLPCEDVIVPRRSKLLQNAPRTYRNGIHRGIDFYADWGTPVRAIAAGTVIRADHNFREVSEEVRVSLLKTAEILGRTPSDVFEHVLLGQAVYIDHGMELVPGYRTVSIYAHLSHVYSDIIPGAKIVRGQKIALTGNSGTRDSTIGSRNGSHLHWELILQNKNGEYYLGQGIDYEDLYPLLLTIFSDE